MMSLKSLNWLISIDALVDYMSKHPLHSLLSRGTKTWQSGDMETTIDLILASTELAEEMVKRGIHYTNMTCPFHRMRNVKLSYILDREPYQLTQFQNGTALTLSHMKLTRNPGSGDQCLNIDPGD